MLAAGAQELTRLELSCLGIEGEQVEYETPVSWATRPSPGMLLCSDMPRTVNVMSRRFNTVTVGLDPDRVFAGSSLLMSVPVPDVHSLIRTRSPCRSKYNVARPATENSIRTS